ncbi:uncharacterized protein LOC103314581 [Tribolium castaneum]|uniref:F-box domain-containing protein n=1 Tax=Tribolium castaneum TaxID=7070 RepID=D6WY87_TRICA|nr:PREDICTED: uncharacterized protein LOC103314581 [Tribolium castaneum]EFA07736.1 hypothetical protein TcasGA2_TC002214 [Tribolium castaneum]|eukprot:XP_008199206.1 PREDICTED: uncharacterized protein LOC103314581 [Tribolium castaneum]
MDDHDSAYYLRSKKRKVDDGEEATCSYSNKNPFKRKNPIMLMPLEILQNVFKFITYQELSEKVRKVNRKFKLAAEDLLNKTFKSLAKKLQHLTATTFKAIEATQDDMEIKCLCRLLNLLDIINFQQTVIMATIWRYVYNEFYRTPKSCMYGGLILDLFEHFLYKFTTKPYQIYGPAVVKDYALPEDVKHIIHLTKNFCIHFDKVSEEPIKNALSVSGCKIVDLLDCATYASKNVIFERITGNTFSAKYCYYLQNAWFVAFGIPPDKEMSLKQKQRMMHMRIRRIILAHTEMFMQQNHYERETLVRANPIIKKPSVVVYTGYGDVHDTFFCYGAMNDAAYLQKFHLHEDQQDEDVEDELHNDEVMPNPEGVDQQDEFFLIPHLGLDIDIRIDCPLAYAPYKYIIDNEEMIRDEEKSSNGMFNLCIQFNFPGAHYPRLPTAYSYHKRISTRQY